MPKNNSKANRERRHNEALQRQAEYDALTPQQRRERLWTRAPGLAFREVDRLRALEQEDPDD